MTFELMPAIAAGATAAVLMLIIRIGMKKMGVPFSMNVLSILGGMVGRERMAGLIIHIVLGTLFALPYALGFQYLNITENLWLWGTLGGFIHWIISGGLLGMMAGISSYAKNFGKHDVVGFLIGHLLFGFFVGTCYVTFIPLL